MSFLVTAVTNRYPIRDVKTKFGVVRKWFFVMRHKIAAPLVTTILTAEFVAGEYIVPPTLILLAKPLVSAFRKTTILE